MKRRALEAALMSAPEARFQILRPALRDDDIADHQCRIRAAPHAGHDDARDVEVVERHLRRHGRVDHADPTLEDDDVLALDAAAHELDALDAADVGVLDQGAQDDGFRLEGCHDRDEVVWAGQTLAPEMTDGWPRASIIADARAHSLRRQA